jgi:RimJ/RimL family protein N-acetyltransferase
MKATAVHPLVPIAQDSDFLQTRRLRLRPFQPADAGDLLTLDTNARVGAWLLDDHVENRMQALLLIDWLHRFYVRHPGLGIWHASDSAGEFLGQFSLMPVGSSGDVELGARLLPRAWGRGYALEGGRALCAHAFETLRLRRLIGLCHPHNRSVPPVLRRLGFEGPQSCEHFGKPALRFELPLPPIEPAIAVGNGGQDARSADHR